MGLPRATFAPALLVLAALLAGCADGAEGPERDGQGRYVVRLGASSFEPRELRVPVGATVVWVNGHDVLHNVEGFEETRGSSFDSQWPPPHGMGRPLGAAGEEWARTFPEPGTWRIHCHFHHAEIMVQTLVVGDGNRR